MKDNCCRHKLLLSHDCVKCIKYKDSFRLKRSLLNEQLKLSVSIEVKCIHGNDSSKCEKCLILKDSVKMLCIHGRNDVSKCEKCSILKDSDKMLCIHGRTHNTCGNCIRRKNEKMKRKMINSNRKMVFIMVKQIINILSKERNKVK